MPYRARTFELAFFRRNPVHLDAIFHHPVLRRS